MRSMLRSIVAATLLLLGSSISANAASLRLAPTTLELFAPDSAAVLNLRNEAKYPLNVQVRVFRWIQQGGVEQLEPTSDVVASPPSTSLPPNADYVVRILRVNKTPVKRRKATVLSLMSFRTLRAGKQARSVWLSATSFPSFSHTGRRCT